MIIAAVEFSPIEHFGDLNTQALFFAVMRAWTALIA